MRKRVVITGAGVVNPVGYTLDELWQACLEGRSGVGRVSAFDPTDYATHIAAEVSGFAAEEYFEPKLARRCDRFAQFGIAAGLRALADSGLEITERNRDRVGILMSSGIGGMITWEEQHRRLLDGGPGRVSPFLVP